LNVRENVEIRLNVRENCKKRLLLTTLRDLILLFFLNNKLRVLSISIASLWMVSKHLYHRIQKGAFLWMKIPSNQSKPIENKK